MAASHAVRLAAAAIALATANAAVYNVGADGRPMSLTDALEKAGAGDTIKLADGVYREPIVTQRSGEYGKPLTIEGGRGAVVNYFSGDQSVMWSQKVVDIKHSWITLRGFTVDGHLDNQKRRESFVDKCIWVESLERAKDVAYAGATVKSAIIGTVIEDMKIHNCGMECIRMRNFVTNSVIQNNDISDCGIYDFVLDNEDGSVIGEAIYIGTSSNQWCSERVQEVRDICLNDGDGCNYNLVKNNRLEPKGNECVDIKEGSSFNVVEYNDCSDQRDAKSGCYDSRGNENTFRYNTATECDGAGIRLGGHEIDGKTYGVDNHVYGNSFSKCEVGSIKAMRHPQGVICDNECKGDSDACEVREKGDDDEIEKSWEKGCPSLPEVPFIDGPSDGQGPTPTPPTPTPPTPTPPFSGGFTCNGVLSNSGEFCCSAGCGECGGKGCSKRGNGLDGDDCCQSNIKESGKKCSETGSAPCMVDEESNESTPKTCSNGIPGIDAGGKVCCPLGCNQCGGKGCSNSGRAAGLGWGECCGAGVKATKKLCSESGEAPCMIDEGITCSNGIPGIDAGGKVCCPLGCKQCGGKGCTHSGRAAGLGWAECCGSGIKETQPKCSKSGAAPCVI